MKILIVGCGGQGGACASILARQPGVEEIRIVDLNEQVAINIRNHITTGAEKISVGKADATDPEDVAKNAEGKDVVVDMVMPWMVKDVMLGALKAGAHYINTAFDTPFWEEFRNGATPETLTMSKEFKDAGLTALFGCGFAPGWTNVIARRLANRLDSVESIRIRVGKHVSIQGETEYDRYFRPWNPGWSPKQALIDCATPTFAFEEGKFVEYAPYGGMETCVFPAPMGEQPVTHHSHEENYSMPATFNGVKNVEFKYNLQPQPAIFYAMGLLSQKKIDVGGIQVAPLDVIAACIAPPAESIFGATDEQLAYADKTSFTELVVEVAGIKGGKKVLWRANCPKMNAPGPALKKLFGTALVYVALPLAIGTLMLGEKIRNTEEAMCRHKLPKGIIFADQLNLEDFINRMRMTGYPYTWTEQKLTVME